MDTRDIPESGQPTARSSSSVTGWSASRWTIVLAGALVLAGTIAWAIFIPIADWIANHDVGNVTGSLRTYRLQLARDAARGRLLTLGAGVFAAGALVFTARNFTLARRMFELTDRGQRRTLELTEQGQVTDRYTRAIEQLGSDKLDVRIGAIYALERIAFDSSRDHPTVMEVLAAFIREHSHEPSPLFPPHQGEPTGHALRPDIQAATTVIARRQSNHDRERDQINLADVNLAGVSLFGANLRGVNLARANLTGAVLTSSALCGINLVEANLTGAQLSDADLAGAKLTGSDLTGAELAHANISAAVLSHAILYRGDLTGANLTDAILVGTILDRADFTDAHLANAKLLRAELHGANLVRTDLQCADLTRVDLACAALAEANFARADLTSAYLSPGVLVPKGWERDPGSGRLCQLHSGS